MQEHTIRQTCPVHRVPHPLLAAASFDSPSVVPLLREEDRTCEERQREEMTLMELSWEHVMLKMVLLLGSMNLLGRTLLNHLELKAASLELFCCSEEGPKVCKATELHLKIQMSRRPIPDSKIPLSESHSVSSAASSELCVDVFGHDAFPPCISSAIIHDISALFHQVSLD